MQEKPFCATHVHSFLSVLDGCGSIERYVEKAKSLNHPALAITEHGNMSSAYDLHDIAKKAGVKPILGCEFYLFREKDEFSDRLLEVYKERALARGEVLEEEDEGGEVFEDDDESTEEVEATSKKKTKKKDKSDIIKDFDRERYHQIVLVKNDAGWKNICKLNYYSFQKPDDSTYQEGKGLFYYKPMIKRPFLFEAKEGLIVTTSCLISEINRYIRYGLYDDAYALFERYKQQFGNDFYVEIQLNGVDDGDANQKLVNEKLIEFAKASDSKIILTGDTHYVDKGDGAFQDVMMAIAQGKKLDDPKLFTLGARNLHFQTREDYHQLNAEYGYNYSAEFIDECLDNTLEIADKVNFGFSTSKNYPKFNDSADDSKKQLAKLVTDALRDYILEKNMDATKAKRYKDRVKFEYDIIVKNGYSDYMLVVWDVVRFAKEKGITMGVGRGSVGSCLVAYLLGIAGLDPMEYDLFFERFINPEALSEPDIDMDFDSERRQEIIDYLKQKWGEENVVQVANFMTFNIKGSLRDLMRVFGRSYEDSNFLASDKVNMPEDLDADTIDDWFKKHETDTAIGRRILTWYESNQDIIECFKKMHGETRNLGLHAGGVLITPEPVYNYIPVNRSSKTLITGFPEAAGSVGKEGKISRASHKVLSSLGLLKLDILGLKTVTVIRKIVELVERRQQKDIRDEVYKLNLKNPELYREFSKGDNKLIFQFESSGISELIRKAKPKNFEHVAAINSLYRPAALNSGAAMAFADVCSGQKELEKTHPSVDEILKNTGGVIAYQEQLSRIINACTGIPFGKCEKMRKSIGDRSIGKYPELFEEFNLTFVDLCVKHVDMDRDVAEKLKQTILDNAGYLFNASHAFSYAYLAMQTLYLKMYYPEEFYSVCLTETNKDTELFSYISDAMKNGIQVEPPSILHSEMNFVPIKKGMIACGVSMVKGVKDKAYDEILQAQQMGYATLPDFLLHPWKKFNRGHCEALVKVGAFKDFEPNTKIALMVTEHHFDNRKDLNKLNRKKEVKYSGDMLRELYENLKNDNVSDFSEPEMDAMWLESTGFRYPFRNRFMKWLDNFAANGIVAATSWSASNKMVYGEVLSKEQKFTVNDMPFYRFKISDGCGDITVKVWDNQMRRAKSMNITDVGDLICIDLDFDETYGYNFSNSGKFINLSR